jgi:hypothetical protein
MRAHDAAPEVAARNAATPKGSDVSLSNLAELIRDAHALAIRHAEDALSHARITGELLIQARAAVPRGQWLPWLAEHCPDLSTQRAQRYMRLARALSGPDASRVMHLSQRTALAALAALAAPRSTYESRSPITAPEIRRAADAVGLEEIPPELQIAVEPGNITAGLIDGKPVIIVAESQRHRGYWYVVDLGDKSYYARPILAAAAGLLVCQIPGWNRCVWHMTVQRQWFPEVGNDR